MTSKATQDMNKRIAVVCSDKLYRIRQAVAAEPRSSLSDRILRILDEPASLK